LAEVGVSAVLVSYNTREMLERSVSTLLESPLVEQIIVVDNASSDGSCCALTGLDPRVHVVVNENNVGFARAVNAGLRVAEDRHHLIINPDCLLAPASLATMVEWLEGHEGVAVVAPATYHPSRKLGVLSAGELPDLRRIVLHYSGLSALLHRYRWARGWNLLAGKHDDVPRSVAWVSGSCLLARQGLLASVGGFSERWFMYAEDMELCARVSTSGLELIHLPSATATHVIGASSEAGPVPTRWVSVLVDYYATAWRPGKVRRVAYQLVLAAGLASRGLANAARSMMSDTQADRKIYKKEARRNMIWARTALWPERSHLDSPGNLGLASHMQRGCGHD
jgi:N-acetylglucosaminyl-diphospho-decaprenol L-rhamnosyltransferase